jgi:exopolyphosphatase/guanosine-5'-triphosphate,3'-diphosphate pyrophosphatase
LAAIFYRVRIDTELPMIQVMASSRGFVLAVDASWLNASPLTASILEEEVGQWNALGMELKVRRERRVGPC